MEERRQKWRVGGLKKEVIKRKEDSLGGGRVDAGNRGDKGCEGIVCLSVYISVCVYNCRSLC